MQSYSHRKVLLGILLGTSGNCEYDIRLWLWVVLGVNLGYALFFIVVIVISLLVKETPSRLHNVGYIATFIQGIIGLFMLAWLIVGNIWLYSSDDCSSDWLAGFVITLIFLILGYIAFALTCCICCCLCCGIGVFGIISIKKEQDSEQA
jgi:NO-binding membrane sensor protein with MHYT domain